MMFQIKIYWRKLILLFILVFSLPACLPPRATHTLPTSQENQITLTTTNSKNATSADPVVETMTPAPTMPPSDTETALSDLSGPLLLLQTDVNNYHVIDFSTLALIPFDPPGPDQHVKLAENHSPSGTKMLFPADETEMAVFSFVTGKTQTTYFLNGFSSVFQPERAVEAARDALPGLKYSDEALLSGVKSAYIQSMKKIKWYQSDRYRLTVLDGSETSTRLTLDDDQTGMRETLEKMPALVEEFWVGPDGDRILLKKSTIFEPGVWQDDRYYLVDVRRRQVDPIPLPENADNPRVFWFSPEKVGIIHHPAPAGGVDFSLFDVAAMETVQVVTGPFIGVYPFGTHLLSLHHDQPTQTSILAASSMNSQDIFFTQTLEDQCFVNARVDDRRLLLNCEEKSILVEEDALALTPFGQPIFLFVRSPNRSRIVKVSKDGQTTILNEALDLVEEIPLEADPLEIFWLPDSSGFLYRTPGNLYLYNLKAKSNHLLITSDFFGDYRNINAVWIRTE